MNISLLSITSFSGLVLLVIHSYFLRGPRTTFNFFFFAFLWAMRKESSLLPSETAIAGSLAPPYELVRSSGQPIFLSVFTVVIGWIFAFYLSWCLAELILRRINYYKDRLFPTLLLSALIIGSISYCMETPAIAVGWWQWRMDVPEFSIFLKGYPYVAFSAWFFCGIYFLSAFFLIECSKFRETNWKGVFFLIPFMHVWTIYLFGNGFPRIIERTLTVSILIILAFLSRMKIEHGRMQEGTVKTVPPRMARLLHYIPVAMALFMILVALMLELVIVKDPVLIISLLPVLLFVILSIKKIPFVLPLIVSAAGGMFIGEKIIAVWIPMALVILLLGINNFQIQRRE
jgi:hypothetical protein